MFSKVLSKKFFSYTVKPKATQLLIGGKWVNSASGKTFDTINPTNE